MAEDSTPNIRYQNNFKRRGTTGSGFGLRNKDSGFWIRRVNRLDPPTITINIFRQCINNLVFVFFFVLDLSDFIYIVYFLFY